VGRGAGLDRCGKSRPTGIDPRTVQPVASRYTDYAIAAPFNEILLHSIFILALHESKMKNMYVCICMYVCTYVCMYVCIYVCSTHKHTQIHTDKETGKLRRRQHRKLCHGRFLAGKF
jgi:hypothetical protein